MTQVSPHYYKMGRLEGTKKTGESVAERKFTCDVMIVGVSRVDLENKIDTMLAALYLRGQQLSTHANDGRYYIADCINTKIELAQGNVVHTTAQLEFISYTPYAVAGSTSSFDTGTVSLTLQSGSTYIYNTSFAGGGNVFNRPQIRVYLRNSTTWSSISITQQNDGQTISISSGLPTSNGNYIDIYCDPTGVNGFTVVKLNTTLLAFNGVFPVMEPVSTNWQISINASAVPQIEVLWQWTARWLS